MVGAGGHAKVVIATLRAAGLRVQGVLDDQPHTWGQEVLGCPVLGGLDQLERPCRAVIAIGANRVRQRVSARFAGVEWVSAVHPAATVHDSAVLGAGTVVFAGAVVQPSARLGRHVIVNTGASVDHDCVLGDFVHVAPGSRLAGQVQVGEGTLLGVGSAVAPGLSLGAWSTVGAGGVVVRPLPGGVVATGVPARVRRSSDPQA